MRWLFLSFTENLKNMIPNYRAIIVRLISSFIYLLYFFYFPDECKGKSSQWTSKATSDDSKPVTLSEAQLKICFYLWGIRHLLLGVRHPSSVAFLLIQSLLNYKKPWSLTWRFWFWSVQVTAHARSPLSTSFLVNIFPFQNSCLPLTESTSSLTFLSPWLEVQNSWRLNACVMWKWDSHRGENEMLIWD